MPGNPNVDNMTYEQLLELEENNGKVSKGLTPAQIRAIPEKMWMSKHDSVEDQCSICFEKFERRQKIKTRQQHRCKTCKHYECFPGKRTKEEKKGVFGRITQKLCETIFWHPEHFMRIRQPGFVIANPIRRA